MFNIINKYNDFDYNNEHYGFIKHRAVKDGGAMNSDITR